MTECVRCGACCHPITTGWTKKEVASRGDQAAVAFIRKHWKRISQAEGVRREKELAPGHMKRYRWDIRSRMTGTRFYECDMFDRELLSCTVQDGKPSVCSAFPWYGKEPTAEPLRGLPACSFWLDIPEDERPEYVEVVA